MMFLNFRAGRQSDGVYCRLLETTLPAGRSSSSCTQTCNQRMQYSSVRMPPTRSDALEEALHRVEGYPTAVDVILAFSLGIIQVQLYYTCNCTVWGSSDQIRRSGGSPPPSRGLSLGYPTAVDVIRPAYYSVSNAQCRLPAHNADFPQTSRQTSACQMRNRWPGPFDLQLAETTLDNRPSSGAQFLIASIDTLRHLIYPLQEH